MKCQKWHLKQQIRTRLPGRPQDEQRVHEWANAPSVAVRQAATLVPIVLCFRIFHAIHDRHVRAVAVAVAVAVPVAKAVLATAQIRTIEEYQCQQQHNGDGDDDGGGSGSGSGSNNSNNNNKAR